MIRGKTFVYFVKPVGAPGPVKIGCSEYPVGRLSTLMCWAPFPLELVVAIPGGRDLERNIQECFFDQYSHREWFHPSARLSALMNALQNGVPIAQALDLSKRLGRMRVGRAPGSMSPQRRRYLSYTHRIRRTAKRLRDGAGDYYCAAPDDAAAIMDRWCGARYCRPYREPIEPTEQEISRLDEVLASPAEHFVRRYFDQAAA